MLLTTARASETLSTLMETALDLMKPRRPVIEVSGLHVKREAVIIERIDWRVERGEHWIILGPNGSGKTSLLRTLTGYLPPTAGSIAVLGETYGRSDWRQLRTRIGLVSSSVNQLMAENETALAAVVSGKYAQIGFWGKMRPADHARGMRILRQTESSLLWNRPWRHLSQGERQRVMIGRALMAHPRLLILDEPCAGLDPAAREHFLQFLERLARKRSTPTIVFVTHHVEEIMPAFSHVLLLKAGAVGLAGRKTEVLTSQKLTVAFGAPIRLSLDHGRYSLKVTPRANKVT